MTEQVVRQNVKVNGEWITIVPHMAEAAIKDGTGNTITLTYATKNEVQQALTNGSVTKVGTATVGATSAPIYLINGVPTVCDKVATTEGNTFTLSQTIKTNNRPQLLIHATSGTARMNLKSDDGANVGSIFSDGTDVRLEGSRFDQPSAIVTKGWSANTTGLNNLLHTDGTEMSTGTKIKTSSGTGTAASAMENNPLTVMKTTGFDRTTTQGVNRHYPLTQLIDKNNLNVCKLGVVTTDTEISLYVQFTDKSGTSRTMYIGKLNRDTGTVTKGWEL